MPPITKEVLFHLVDLMVSASTHSSAGISASGAAWLNPQPLPPGSTQTPHPEVWRAAAVARQVISMAALANAADEDNGIRTAQSMLSVFVDDFCGTAPSRRLPLPPPWPRSGIKPNAVDLLVAAAQFHAVANAMKGHPIAKSLNAGSDRLLEVGLRRLER